MTLRIIDGFDYFPATGIPTVAAAMGWFNSYDSVSASNTTAFGSGKSLAWNASGNVSTRVRQARDRYTSARTYVVGMRCWIPTNVNGLRFGTIDTFTVDSLSQWYINFTSDGSIYLYRGNDTLQAKTKAGSFTAGKWFYLEIKWVPGSSSTFELCVNTVPVLSLVNAETSRGTLISPAALPGFDLFYEWSNNISSGSSNSLFDDFYFLDSAGSTNNDYLGNVRVVNMPPIANGDLTQWAIGGSAPAASNWQSVLNYALDDTKYNYSSTVGDRDLYDVNPVLNTPFVYGIEVAGAYRMDDATQRVVRNTIRSGSSDAFGANRYINQNYTFYSDIFETSPATGVSFTGSEVNGLQIGPEVVT